METIKKIWASAPWWAWVIMIGSIAALIIGLIVYQMPSGPGIPYLDSLWSPADDAGTRPGRG